MNTTQTQGEPAMDTTAHRDSIEGLFARLADACYSARGIIADINADLPMDGTAEKRESLEKMLQEVEHLADSHVRIDWQNIVTADEFARVNDDFVRTYITGAWERRESNEVTWVMALKFNTDEYDVHLGTMHLELTIDGNQDGRKFQIVECIGIYPSGGITLDRAVGRAQSEANAFLRAVKRTLCI